MDEENKLLHRPSINLSKTPECQKDYGMAEITRLL